MWFPSPHSGILFLFLFLPVILKQIRDMFPSPHSGILFLYLILRKALRKKNGNGFRPLIRGFFFYFRAYNEEIHEEVRFRPLIRGFFFYASTD